MRVLLDENLPHDLRSRIPQHETFTAAYMGWSGFRNGRLLSAAAEGGFDVLVTGDKTLHLEQNLTARKIAIVSLSAVAWPLIEPCIAEIVIAIERVLTERLVKVDCGMFSRRRKHPSDPV